MKVVLATSSWKSLADAERVTKREYGDDVELFYFYEHNGKWKRSLVIPPGAKRLKTDTVGRAVIDVKNARRGSQKDWSVRSAPGYLYHLTTSPAYLKIRTQGLKSGLAGGIAVEGSGYEEHSRDGVFMTDAAGIKHWARQQLAKYGERVLLRTKIEGCPIDEPGTREARMGSDKKTTAYKCKKPVPAERLEVFDVKAKAWRPVSDVRLSTTEETILERKRNPSRIEALAQRLAEGF